ncbi:hypothetical protein M231_06985 [Tremella mesenterica]|uniref:Coatomer subunit epsilon n=1 Tax=Tremella mesenterica TaxID=5217 RepID=A0A4Q1BD54_TREME|nr:hypothetical protein M231_06985 [Tremella mesenterica]
MEADPLFLVKQLFYQASYEACITESISPISPPDPSFPEHLHRTLYAARAHLALHPSNPSAALELLTQLPDPSVPSARAVTALAKYVSGEDKASKVEELRDLVLELEGDEGDKTEEGVVRVIAATVFILENEKEEAVATLTEGCAKEDLECIALLVQLLLSMERRDLAQSAYASAKKIGNDSALVQAIEAWIGLKTGARPLHQSYYYYEELYQLPSGRTPPVLASHAAAHLLLGHVEEAKADVVEASQRQGGDSHPDVLAIGTSLRMEGYSEKLATLAGQHPFAVDLKNKNLEFDEAAAKFAISA